MQSQRLTDVCHLATRLTLALFMLAAIPLVLHAELPTTMPAAESSTPTEAKAAIPTPKSVEHPGETDAPIASPRTYPDEPGFQKRAQRVMEALASSDLSKWRKGYFAKRGDPGKYLPGYVMARLVLNPDDAQSRKYMNDNRSFKEHYHFAAVNWARFYPLFAETVLTPETRKKFAQQQFRYTYLPGHGTENHRVMWWTSAAVLPWYTNKGTQFKPKEHTLDQANRILRDYVKGLYAAGQGEWDSSTYVMFDINGLLNIYDFSKDDEARLLARAGLDYLATAYALKYTDGVYCGPNQRGYAAGPHSAIADHTGYVWWGSNAEPTPKTMQGFRYTMHAITSSYRPNKVITNLALKKLPSLPTEQRNTKPPYWHASREPRKPGFRHESLYLRDGLTMGSLWDGHASQHTRFMIVAASDTGGKVFSGGHPRKSDHNGKRTGLGYRSGIGRYFQSAQVGSVFVGFAETPEKDPASFTFFSFPEDVTPKRKGDWYVFTVGENTIAVKGLGSTGELTEVEATKRRPAHPILRFDGRRSGFVVRVGDRQLKQEDLDNLNLDTSRFKSEMTVAFTTPDGRRVVTTYDRDGKGLPGDRPAKVTIDGEPMKLDSWPIYGGPYVKQTPGVLTVNDGKDGFTIDFTGDLPVYKPWRANNEGQADKP